jgi:hypothetical protein
MSLRCMLLLHFRYEVLGVRQVPLSARTDGGDEGVKGGRTTVSLVRLSDASDRGSDCSHYCSGQIAQTANFLLSV